MTSEILHLLYACIAFIAGITLMVRLRLFHGLLPAFLHQRIHDELHRRLKVSAPHLWSTLEGVGFDSGSSTSSARYCYRGANLISPTMTKTANATLKEPPMRNK